MVSSLSLISQGGTSIWLDDLSRERLVPTGKLRSLASLIMEDHVVGVTSNPAIFSQSISNSDLYRKDIRRLADGGATTEEIITILTSDDVRNACDLFQDIYLKSKGIDGRVSIEVDPRLARDTKNTISQARYLWKLVDRPNVLIKVPATVAGLPAIRALISEGISVNVTIIFSIERYKDVLDSFLLGLEDRIAKNLPVTEIESVASFFVSRVDSEIDAQLKSHGSSAHLQLLGKAAIANARLAYEVFLQMKNSLRWKSLAAFGAHIQRPLWASTGVKDKTYDDTRYVIDLMAPDTVNTMPETTLNAVKDHGKPNGDAITKNIALSHQEISAIEGIGISLESVAKKLESEGIDKFITPWIDLIENVEKATGR